MACTAVVVTHRVGCPVTPISRRRASVENRSRKTRLGREAIARGAVRSRHAFEHARGWNAHSHVGTGERSGCAWSQADDAGLQCRRLAACAASLRLNKAFGILHSYEGAI